MSSIYLNNKQVHRTTKRGRDAGPDVFEDDLPFEGSEPKIPHLKTGSPLPAAVQPLNANHVVEWITYTGAEIVNAPGGDTDSSSEGERYIYEDILGEGAFGIVEKVLDTSTDRWLAIKKLKDPEDIETVLYANRENAILKQLRDYHTPHRLNWIDGHNDSITTEYIPEADIAEVYLIEEATHCDLTFNEVITIFRQSLEFLSSLRKQGIIHGDLKLENMIYERLVRYLTILDCGGAILPTDKKPIFCTTRDYKCPEVILKGPSNRTEDLWSLACVIYELLTKETLFKFDSKKSDSQSSNDEKDICHLDMIHHQIGLPSPAYLKKCLKAKQFYTPAGLPENPPQENHTPKWDVSLRQVARDKKIPPNQMEQLISLLRTMLRYENRATPEELLKSPLFEEDVCFHLADGLPKEGQILINRISDVARKTLKEAENPLLTIDLSDQVTRTCYHLPRMNRYEISVLRPDQSLMSKLQFDIRDGAILDLKPYFTHQ